MAVSTGATESSFKKFAKVFTPHSVSGSFGNCITMSAVLRVCGITWRRLLWLGLAESARVCAYTCRTCMAEAARAAAIMFSNVLISSEVPM